MAFRLETYQFDCRANMPTRYGRDLRCRACCHLAGSVAVPGGPVQESHDETQEHLEECRGYAELWEGLGPYSLKTRCKYFMRVKNNAAGGQDAAAAAEYREVSSRGRR